MSALDGLAFTPPRDDCPVCPEDGLCDLACIMGAMHPPAAQHALADQPVPAEGQE